MADPKNISIAQLASIGSFVGMVIFAFLFFESRYDAKGMSARAELKAKIYVLDMQISQRQSVIERYTVRRELGVLDAADVGRQEQLVREQNELKATKQGFEQQLNNIKDN